MSSTVNNHYVPQWHQNRFFPAGLKEQKLYYLKPFLELNTILESNHANLTNTSGNLYLETLAESFFGCLKTGQVFFISYKTGNEAKNDIIDDIEMFYNSRRRHSYLGHVSPMEYEDTYRWLSKMAIIT